MTRLTRAGDGREWGHYVSNLRRQGRNLSELAHTQSHCWMRDHLPFGRDLPRLGRTLDRGHGPNPTMSCRHRIYYHHVKSRNRKNIKGKRLTFDHNVLTSLLVMLATTADPIRKTVALMVECLTPLASWDVCHQLVLNPKDQYLGRLATEKKDTRSRKSSTCVASPQSPPTT